MKQAGRSPLMFLLGAKALACHAVSGGGGYNVPI